MYSHWPDCQLADPFNQLLRFAHHSLMWVNDRRNLTIAVAAVLSGKLDNIGGQTLLVVTTTRDLALR